MGRIRVETQTRGQNVGIFIGRIRNQMRKEKLWEKINRYGCPHLHGIVHSVIVIRLTEYRGILNKKNRLNLYLMKEVEKRREEKKEKPLEGERRKSKRLKTKER